MKHKPKFVQKENQITNNTLKICIVTLIFMKIFWNKQQYMGAIKKLKRLFSFNTVKIN